MEEKLLYLSNEFKNAGFTFSKEQERKFYVFYEILAERNKVMNLTGITEFSEVVEKHFLDSLFLHRIVDLRKSVKMIDLGTGAGFPGIPLKIAFPEIEITLLDSLKKRILFLDDVIKELGLSSVSTVHARAEEVAHDFCYREKFDICVSRAVANLSTLEEYCLPFVRIDGKFISYKSGDIDDEVSESEKACFLLGGKLDQVSKFHLAENRRSFVVIKKVKKTPKQYPRKAGIPSKSPLK